MIAAGGSFCMLDSSAKYLVTAGYRAEFVTWVRFLIHVPLVLIAFRAWHNPGPFRVRSLPLQVCRGLALLGATLLNFSALRTLQLDQAVVIGFLAPVVITALSGPLLREWPGWRRWLAVFAGLAGVLVIVRPGFGGFQVGHLYALGAMVSMSLYTLMTRYLGASETTQSLTLFPALTAVLLLLPMVLPVAEVPHDPVELTLLLGLGLWGALGHYLVVCAHKMATAAALAPYPYLGIVWAIGSGYVVFGQLPDQWTLAGAAIIIGGALYVMGREHQLRERNGQ
ncbi:DMT family transporter [Pelagibacterium lacus]|uniref:DMT family transporter n=2 Tax=Pelagibacterium lacus TaxID=2282655 RepID=A0A369W6N3_9HYPH|nr:DMT family transporter [Pelagibacterium lacus]